MNQLESMAKRGLNVITVLTSLWLVLVVIAIFSSGVSSWVEFISKNIYPALAAYGIVGIANYIFFGKFTLWQKPATARNPD